MFKGKLERFVGGQVGSIKRMGAEIEGRLYKVTNDLQKVGKRYQETTDFMNLTQQELEEKTYLEEFTTKLNSLNGQEENLKNQLDEIRAKKDTVTLQMRSAAINKKLQFENCERVVKQLKDQLAGLGAEKNELDVQSEIIRQQVNNYTEMRRSLANVKLNDLKSTVRVFEQEQYTTDYSQINTNQVEQKRNENHGPRPNENQGPRSNENQGPQIIQQNNAGPSAESRPAAMNNADQLDIFSDFTQPSQKPADVQVDLL